MARSFGGNSVNISAISETCVRSSFSRNSSQRCCAASSVHSEGEAIAAGIGTLILPVKCDSVCLLCGLPVDPELFSGGGLILSVCAILLADRGIQDKVAQK